MAMIVEDATVFGKYFEDDGNGNPVMKSPSGATVVTRAWWHIAFLYSFLLLLGGQVGYYLTTLIFGSGMEFTDKIYIAMFAYTGYILCVARFIDFLPVLSEIPQKWFIRNGMSERYFDASEPLFRESVMSHFRSRTWDVFYYRRMAIMLHYDIEGETHTHFFLGKEHYAYYYDLKHLDEKGE